MITNNSGALFFNEIPSYTFVSIHTLRNTFPPSHTQANANDLEDQIDNMRADIALREARTKGTKSWSNLKRELNL